MKRSLDSLLRSLRDRFDFSSRRRGDGRRQARPPRVEPLEDRLAPAAGALDLAFNGTGKAIIPVGTSTDEVNAVVRQPDGKLVLAGRFYAGGNSSPAVVRLNVDGTLDTTFDGDGKATFPEIGLLASATAVTLDANGKIILAGFRYGSNYDFVVARLNTNGTLDTTFDADGWRSYDFGNSSDTATAVAVQPDGQIVVAGKSAVSGAYADFAVIRVSATTGALDTTFGSGGWVQVNFAGSDDEVQGMALQPDGKIVVAGYAYNGRNLFAAARLNPDGSTDAGFGVNGMVTIAIGTVNDTANGLALQPDGKIVLAGSTRNGTGDFDMAAVRLTATGALDATFSGDGIAVLPVGTTDDKATDVAVQPDGKIVLVGYGGAAGSEDFAVGRLTVAGAADSSFDFDGKATFAMGAAADVATAVVVQPDGKLVVAGRSHNGSNDDFAVARLDINYRPVLVLNPVAGITESGTATLTGTIFDPDTVDTFALTINWGDPLSPNNVETYTFGASASGSQTFTLSHQYLDNPAGSPTGSFTIAAMVTDSEGGRSGQVTLTPALTGDFNNTDFNNATTAPFQPVPVADRLVFSTTGIAHSHTGTVTVYVDVRDPSTTAWTPVYQRTLANGEQFDFNGLTIDFASQAIDRVQLRSTPGQDYTFHYWGSLSLTVLPMAGSRAVQVSNVAPTAGTDTALGSQNTPVTVTVLANDSDPAGGADPLTVQSVTQGAHGGVAINANGTVTYTPVFGYFGPDTFTYTITDGDGGVGTGTVNVTINAPPGAGNDSATTPEDSSALIDVLANDTDPDGDPLSIQSVTPSAHGGTAVVEAGQVRYTPALNYHGPDTFTYTVSDGVGGTATATVTVTVTPVADIRSWDGGGVDDNWTTAANWFIDVAPEAGDTLVFAGTPQTTFNDFPDGTSFASLSILTGGWQLQGHLVTLGGATAVVQDSNLSGIPGLIDLPLRLAANATVRNLGSSPLGFTGSIDTNGHALTIHPTVSGTSISFNAAITGAGSLVKGFSGLARLSGSNSYTGLTYVNGGTLRVDNSNGLGAASAGTVVNAGGTVVVYVPTAEPMDVAAGATVEVGNPGELAGVTRLAGTLAGTFGRIVSGPVILTASGATIRSPSHSSGGLIVSGPITEESPGLGLSIGGNGSLVTLAGASSYTGATTVLGGDLVVTGSLGGSSFGLIGNSRLFGTGTISAPVVVAAGSRVAPGIIGAGVLTSGAVSFSPTSTFEVEIDTAAGDQLAVTGTVALAGAILDVQQIAAPAPGASFVLIANDGTTDAVTGTFAGLPEGSTLNVGGTILRITYAGGDGNDVVLIANQLPAAVADAAATDEDVAVLIDVLANDTDPENDPLSIQGVTQPAYGGTAVVEAGQVRYTPAADYHGIDTFTYTVDDGNGGTATATVTVTVAPINDAPLAADASFTTPEDTPRAGTVTGSDAEADPLTFVLVTDATHGTVAFNADGTFTYTPEPDYHGPDGFTFATYDGELTSAPATVTLTVTAVNDAPVATDGAFATDEDAPLADSVAATDVDGDILTYAVVAAPLHGTLVLNADGSFSYTPHLNYHGDDGFTFAADDGTTAGNVATVTLTVAPVNDTPVADVAAFTSDEDAGLAGELAGSDIDGDALTFVVFLDPAHGTINLNPDGSFTYTPEADYFGPDGFLFVVNDGTEDSAPALVSLTVTAVNDAPVADAVTVTLSDDGTSGIDLTGNDIETPAAGLVFTVTSLPARGQLLRPDLTPVLVGGTFTGSPASLLYRLRFAFGDVSDTFTYTARDTGSPALTSAPATVTIFTPAGSAGVAWAAGGEGNDTVVVTHTPAGTNLQVTINGTVVSNTIPLASVTEVRAFGWGGNDSLQFLDLIRTAGADGGAGSDTLRIDGTSAANTFTVADGRIGLDAASIAVGLFEAYTLNGQGGTDTLAGPDTGGTWAVTGANNAGTLNGNLAFATIEALRGGAGDDTFAFAAGRTITGTLDGGDGTDTLTYAAYTTAVSVNLQTGAATGTGGVANLEALVGGTATTDLLTGPNADRAWVLSGVDAGNIDGFTFAGVERLTGGSAVDTLTVLVGGGLTGTFTGGAGSDQILGPEAATMWSITNTNAGTLTGVFAFAAVENLTGGSANDTFVFSAGRAVTGVVAGGGGSDTLDYAAYTTAVTVNLQYATATGTGGITSAEAVIGGSATTDTVVAANDANAWAVTGPNAGTVDGFAFSGVENLTGGTADDTFTVAAAGTWAGTLNGAAGTDTLVGADGANSWVVTATNGGTLNTRAFAGVENLTGGGGADTFAVNAGRSVNGVVAGGGGADTLSYSAYTAAVTVNLQAGSATGTGGFTGIESFVGGTTANDVLVGADAPNAWILSGANAGTLNGATSFAGIERPTGGAVDDTFLVQTGASASAIQGGGGTDTLTYASYGGQVTVNVQTATATATGGFAGLEVIIGSPAADTVIGPNVASTWALTAANAFTLASLAFQAMENATGGTANDTFDLRPGFVLSGTVNGGNGTDTLLGADAVTNWSITAPNAGAVSGMGFAAVENLTGGGLADTFRFADGARLGGRVDGGGGFDQLVYTSAVTVNLQTGSATSGGGTMPFVGVEAVTGNSAADTLTGANAASTWTLTATNQGDVNGFQFDGIEALTGGTADDTFVLAPGAGLTGQAAGGTGAGLDTLSYAAWSTDVTVNLGSNTATNLTGGISSFEYVFGGNGNDTLTGTGANNLLVGNGGNDTLTGGSGRDFLVGGTGADVLSGGAGEDLLIAGWTDYDANLPALKAILAEWGRTDQTYAARVAGLGGSGFAHPLSAATVHADGSADTLTGGGDMDWFFASLSGVVDLLTDRNASQETVTPIS